MKSIREPPEIHSSKMHFIRFRFYSMLWAFFFRANLFSSSHEKTDCSVKCININWKTILFFFCLSRNEYGVSYTRWAYTSWKCFLFSIHRARNAPDLAPAIPFFLLWLSWMINEKFDFMNMFCIQSNFFWGNFNSHTYEYVACWSSFVILHTIESAMQSMKPS